MTEVFDIAATTRSSGTFLIVISAVMGLAMVGIFGYIGATMNHMFIEAGPESIRIRIPMYSKTVKRSDIFSDEVRVIDMNAPDAPRLGMRTNGIGMPGFQGGWYRLKGGRKVLTAITDRSKVVLIPTRLGWDILASVKDPEALISSLKQRRFF